jgi:hypothetical protein
MGKKEGAIVERCLGMFLEILQSVVEALPMARRVHCHNKPLPVKCCTKSENLHL